MNGRRARLRRREQPHDPRTTKRLRALDDEWKWVEDNPDVLGAAEPDKTGSAPAREAFVIDARTGLLLPPVPRRRTIPIGFAVNTDGS